MKITCDNGMYTTIPPELEMYHEDLFDFIVDPTPSDADLNDLWMEHCDLFGEEY